MKTLTAVTALILSVLFICGAKAPDTPVYEYKVDGIYIHDITVAELEDFYRIYGYKDYIYMRDWIYPPIFLTRLPRDFRSIKDPQKRNKLFLQIVGPLALKLGEELSEERLHIRLLEDRFQKQHDLTAEEEKFLEQQAEKYDIFTRLTGERRYAYIFKELLLRVNKLPPSLLMGAAAIESNWGTNRQRRQFALPRTVVVLKRTRTDSRRRNRRQQLQIQNFPFVAGLYALIHP